MGTTSATFSKLPAPSVIPFRFVPGLVSGTVSDLQKENCPDLRNSKVIDIIRELEGYGINVQVRDPLADSEEARHEYSVSLVPMGNLKSATAIVLAVAHEMYAKWGPIR